MQKTETLDQKVNTVVPCRKQQGHIEELDLETYTTLSGYCTTILPFKLG